MEVSSCTVDLFLFALDANARIEQTDRNTLFTCGGVLDEKLVRGSKTEKK